LASPAPSTPGAGFQNYPDDYQVIDELHKRDELTVRLAYNLFTQKPGEELADFRQRTQMTKPGAGVIGAILLRYGLALPLVVTGVSVLGGATVACAQTEASSENQ
jgi:predicted amidohydrolase YtcJ